MDALNGIFRFFLFCKLKSSLPRLEEELPASLSSSSESEESYELLVDGSEIYRGLCEFVE